MEIYPVINCQDEPCVRGVIDRTRKFLPWGGWLHLDVGDGKFSFHKTWNDPVAWPKMNAGLSLEVHLMVEEPESAIEPWLVAGARRVIVHYESLTNQQFRGHPADPYRLSEKIIAEVHNYRAEAFLAVNPETPVVNLKKFFEKFDGAQTLAVTPGLAGQKFQPAVLNKIKFLRGLFPDATIEVDGGITPSTARLVKLAGANVAVSSSYILQSPDPRMAYEELIKATTEEVAWIPWNT